MKLSIKKLILNPTTYTPSPLPQISLLPSFNSTLDFLRDFQYHFQKLENYFHTTPPKKIDFNQLINTLITLKYNYSTIITPFNKYSQTQILPQILQLKIDTLLLLQNTYPFPQFSEISSSSNFSTILTHTIQFHNSIQHYIKNTPTYSIDKIKTIQKLQYLTNLLINSNIPTFQKQKYINQIKKTSLYFEILNSLN